MQDIKHREQKMQEVRKNTPWRDYIRDIASRKTLVFHRYNDSISKFPETNRIKGIMKPRKFEEYRETLSTLGPSYDMNSSFFQNFQNLFQKLDLPSVIHFGLMENCDYADVVAGSKNCYLSFRPINNCENIFYSDQIKDGSRNVLNSVMVRDQSENIYTSKGIISSFNIFYSQYLYNCSNIRFSSDLVGCQECIGCKGLENMSYCINNKQYPKEEYLQHKGVILGKKELFQHYYLALKGHGLHFGSKDFTGKHILKSENIRNSHFVYQVKNGNNLFLVGGNEPMENIYDNVSTGSGISDHIYGVVGAGIGISHLYNCCHINNSQHISYSYFLQNCSYCLGCVGLKNKSFYILNKQYTKEERFAKANDIFAQMESDGTLGKFFPGTINPFYFNDTAAYLIDDSFTKEEVTKEGYLRRDEEIKVDIPEGSQIVYTNSEAKDQALQTMGSERKHASDKLQTLANFQGFDKKGNRTIDPAILKKVIRDDKGNFYRIVKMEYDFLVKHGLPLPELHWLERIKLGFKFQ